jgi:hypothetical protein
VVEDLDELVEAAYWQAMKADKADQESFGMAGYRSENVFKKTAPVRKTNSAVEDMARIRSRPRNAGRPKKPRRAAKEAQPVADRELARERAEQPEPFLWPRSASRSEKSRQR